MPSEKKAKAQRTKKEKLEKLQTERSRRKEVAYDAIRQFELAQQVMNQANANVQEIEELIAQEGGK